MAAATAFLLLFSGGAGFGSDSVAATAEAVQLTQCELYPLAVGSQWLYRSGPLEVREMVVRHETIEGEMCARVETFYEDRVVSYEHIAVRADGVYRVAVSGKPVQPPLRFISLPPKSGTKWTVDSTVGGQPLRGEFVSSEGTFAVRSPRGDPDASFKTHRVTGEKFVAAGAEISVTYDFVAQVGKVKQVARTAGQETTLELKEFLTPGQVPARTAQGGNSFLRQ